jgi:large subunit ribosomal protein L10
MESLCQHCAGQRLFIFHLKGGEQTLAISKQRKEELVAQYQQWSGQSQAMFLTEYKGLSMKQIDDFRGKVREAGGGFHILKNTLATVAFKDQGLPVPEKYLEGSTAVIFAFHDAAGVAKVVTEYARTSEFVKVKGGYLGQSAISASDVKSLAALPPLPVMRAQLLGTIMAPASKLVRTLAEPARQVAAVFKAYADRDGEAAPAAS